MYGLAEQQRQLAAIGASALEGLEHARFKAQQLHKPELARKLTAHIHAVGMTLAEAAAATEEAAS